MPTSIALTPHFESFTKKMVSSGRYNNVSEVIRDSLRQMEEKQKIDNAKLKALRDAVQLGIDDIEAGRSMSFDSAKEFGQYLKSMRAKKSNAAAH